MGYIINLERQGTNSTITAQEWRDFVLTRSELQITDETDAFITAILDGNDRLALHHSAGSGSVFTKNPDGPRIIEYMVSIAPFFDAVVTGDEGEHYAAAADWGTQSDWDTPSSTESKPFWKRELSGPHRLIAGIAFGVILILVKELFFSK